MANGKQSKFELTIGTKDRFSNTFKAFNDRVAAGAAVCRRMKADVQSLSRATGFSRLVNSAGGLVGSLKMASSEGKNLFSSLSGLAGKASLLFGGAGAGALALARGTANAGDAAAKAAVRAGVGIRTWQEYAHAASLSDVSNEHLEKSFRKLQDVGIKAGKGDKASSGLLRLAGINPRTAKGEIKNADSLMLELADKVKALKDSGKDAEATNLVGSVFGDEGAKLMPMLSDGAAGLKNMRMEAHKLGLVFSEQDAANSAGFNDGLTKMWASFRGIGFTIGRQILPIATKLMDKFTEWSSSQREIIGTGFAEWVERIDIDKLWTSIESGFATLGKIGRGFASIAEALGGWGNTIGILAGLMAGKFVLALGSVALAFAKVGIAIMTTPIGWIMAAVAAVGATAYAVYKNWDGIVSYFTGITEEVRAAFECNWLDGIHTLLFNFNPVRLVAKGMNELIKYFTGIDLAEIGSKWVGSIQDSMSAKWTELISWFKAQFAGLTDWMPDWVKEKMGISVNANLSGGDVALATGAEPLNLTPVAKSLAESRTEHVEKSQYELVVRSEDGSKVDVQRTGGTGGSFNLNTGILASGY